ncbi:transposase family protein [Streptomyces sp. NPDC007983]|uniref:transposase family protein n=1 Tax=Streptomyces sp. NPDC007983 TaxID=3364800 RepID=UPI0036E68C25
MSGVAPSGSGRPVPARRTIWPPTAYSSSLVHLRTGLPHAALYGIARSTISRAIGEIRPLPAMRGFAVPDHPGARLRILADVFAYTEAAGIRLRIDGAENQVRRPKAGRPGRRALVSGKKKQNTIKTTTISDGQGRLLWSGADRPDRIHDQTVMRTEGIAEQCRLHPKVTAEVDEGYRGLANVSPDQISAPPKKPKGDVPLGEQYAWQEMRRRQSSERICVEHANAAYAALRQWCPLQRYTGPREDYAATHQAIAFAGRESGGPEFLGNGKPRAAPAIDRLAPPPRPHRVEAGASRALPCPVRVLIDQLVAGYTASSRRRARSHRQHSPPDSGR